MGSAKAAFPMPFAGPSINVVASERVTVCAAGFTRLVVPALGDGIADVFALGAVPKVRGIDAAWVITPMADEIARHLAVPQEVGNVGRLKVASDTADASV
jgi:hypothetical protein